MEQKQLTVLEIDKVTAEILIYKQQTAQNIIEIGKRLIKVKESLPHGEWSTYLKEKVDFSDRTARKFMKVSKEFSNYGTLNSLTKSKMFALLDLPTEERKDFISQHHKVNGQTKTIDEMTSRELQKVIKYHKGTTNRKVVSSTTIKHLINKTNGKCEICDWGGLGLEGILIPHHIHKYADTEDNSINNLALLCPNCHNTIHTLENCKDEKMTYIIKENINKNIINKIEYYVDELL